MTKLEIVLIFLVIVFGSMWVMENRTSSTLSELYTMRINQEAGLRMDMKQTLLDFYTNDYCKGLARTILFKGFNTEFNALYCDKSAILLLMDDLPIAIVHDMEK